MDTIDSKVINEEKIPQGEGAESTASATDAYKWIDDLKESLGGGKHSAAAPMPVEKDSYKYNMNHPKRGKAVLFNHMKFTNGQTSRPGTDKDEKMMNICLTALGFEVVVYNDLGRMEIFKVLESLKREDHSKRDCLLIAVFSHGDQDKLFCADADYRPEDLWNPFTADKCPSLAGKPKIFFIQACRGDQLDSGTRLARTQTDSKSGGQQDIISYVVPNRADFLVVYSTAPGYYAWRNTQEGSWFVQSLIKVLTEYKSKKDLLSMMTIVTREVALNYQSNVPNDPFLDQKKQVPMI